MARVIMLVFRFLIPWLLRVAWFTAKRVGATIVSVWASLPKTARKIADAWVDRAVAADFPTELDRVFYFAASIVAFLVVVAGWILTSFLTVFLIRWILRI